MRCLEIKVLHIYRCPVFMSIHKLLVRDLDAEPLYFSREYSLLNCILIMDILICESLLI